MYRKRLAALLLSCVLLLFSAGCWDRIEIEQRGFVIASAIDLEEEYEGQQEDRQQEEKEGRPKGKARIALTNQMVIPGTVVDDNRGETFNLTASGDTLFECIREMATVSSQSPFYEHIKILVISDEVAKAGYLPSYLDIFLRDHEMSRSVQLLVSEGKAKDILDVQPKNKEMNALYLTSIVNNNYRNFGMMPEMLVGQVHEYLLLDQSFVLPRVQSASSDGVKITGSAVFQGKGDKPMIGFLSSEETEGLNIVLNQARSGNFQTNIKGDLVVYEINNIKTTIRAVLDDSEYPKFEIKVVANGDLAEKYAKLNPLNLTIIKNIEAQISDEIERIVRRTTNKLQKEYKTDVLGFGAYLRRNHNKSWNKWKNDWDRGENIFSQIEIDISAQAGIRQRGTILKSHGEGKEFD